MNIHARRLLPVILAVVLAASAPTATASGRVDAEIAPLLSKLAESGLLPGPEEKPLVLEHPERSYFELGAVVDLRSGDAAGAQVLAVSPNGAADRLGLEPGDRLMAINGRVLASSSDLPAALATTNGTLELDVLRNTTAMALRGSADRVTIPAYSMSISGVATQARMACGRISQALQPPISEDIHRLVIHEIDGRLPGPLASDVFTLPEGRHTIKVSEAIRNDRFTGNQNRKRRGLFRYERFKQFELVVSADTTYRLGARLIRDNREDIRGGSYWEPVVWTQFEERCG